jgi:hypothetical protein
VLTALTYFRLAILLLSKTLNEVAKKMITEHNMKIRVLREALIKVQIDKEFIAFYGTRMFTIVFTRALK